MVLAIFVVLIGSIAVSGSIIMADGFIGSLFIVWLIGIILGVLGLMLVIAGGIIKVVDNIKDKLISAKAFLQDSANANEIIDDIINSI